MRYDLGWRALLLFSLLLLACSRKTTPADAGSGEYETLELKYQPFSGMVAPAELAEELGYLAPLRLRPVSSTTSGPASIQAAATGETDFGGAFNGSVIKLIASKAPIVAVMGYYGVDEQRWAGYYVLDGSPIRKAEDLLGKKVSMNTLGAHYELMLKEFLERNNVPKERAKQVMLVAIPPVNAEQVLRQGQVDAATLGDIYRERALETGGIRPLFSDFELFGRFTAGSYVMRTSFVKRHPKTVRKFVEATGRAIEWSRTASREEVHARMVAVVRKRQLNESVDAIKYWKSFGVAGSHGRLSDADFQVWIDWMVKDGSLAPGQVTPRDVYTSELHSAVAR